MKHITSGHISLTKLVTPPCLPPRGQESTIQLCPGRTRYNLWTALLSTLSLSPGYTLNPVDQVIFKNVSQMVFCFPFPSESKPEFPWLLQDTTWSDARYLSGPVCPTSSPFAHSIPVLWSPSCSSHKPGTLPSLGFYTGYSLCLEDFPLIYAWLSPSSFYLTSCKFLLKCHLA